jgi:hypothetical protein
MLTGVTLEKLEGVRPKDEAPVVRTTDASQDAEKAARAYGTDGCVLTNMKF